MSLKQAVSCIRKHKNFLITSHTNLEGDALGSELAFYRLVKALGKQATIVNEEEAPLVYKFLPGIKMIKKYKERLAISEFDCFALLDCAYMKRSGRVFMLNQAGKAMLNIDHHISNEGFGRFNWIEPKSSSCCEMIYHLFKALGVPFDRDTALLLYVGILTDTGSFRHSNTTAITHRVVSELLSFDLDASEIYRKTYQNLSFKDMRLLTLIMQTMQSDCQGKLIWFQANKALLEEGALSSELAEQILTLARTIDKAEATVLFKEDPGAKKEIRVNLRSQGKVDVNKVARCFGGGGHKTASGATIQGSLEEVKKKVLNKIRNSLK